jgi:hypothetical protein
LSVGRDDIPVFAVDDVSKTIYRTIGMISFSYEICALDVGISLFISDLADGIVGIIYALIALGIYS